MQTINVKKFMLGKFTCYRFPRQTVRVQIVPYMKLPLAATDGELFDDEDQVVLMGALDQWPCAMYHLNGWVRPNSGYLVLIPELGKQNTREFTCPEILNALEENGEFQVGDYTYKVQP